MSTADEIKELDKYWNELLYTICKGDPGKMLDISKFRIFDFFAFIENMKKE